MASCLTEIYWLPRVVKKKRREAVPGDSRCRAARTTMVSLRIRIGATESWPWVKFRGAEPEGIEVELVHGFSRQIDATLRWRRGSETELFEALRRAELDLVIGGLKASTPWSKHVALTQSYLRLEWFTLA